MWRGVGLSNLPCQITKWGQFKDSKWSRHKTKNFRGAQDFFGPLNGTSESKGHFGAKKVDFIFPNHTTMQDHLKIYVDL